MNETLDVGGLVQPLAEWLEVVASGIDLICFVMSSLGRFEYTG